MTARASDRDDECPACGWRAANGCDCDDDGEALEAGYERLSEGEDGRQRTRGCVVIELLGAIASLLLLAGAVIVQADHLAFRSGWLNGVKADGWFELRRSPASPDEDEPHGVLYGRIHCTGGARAIAVNHRVVGCQR